MTPRQAVEKYGPKAAGIAAVAFVALGFAVISPGDKLADHESRIKALEQDRVLVQGLARMQCLEDRPRAELAGIPCATLLAGAR